MTRRAPLLSRRALLRAGAVGAALSLPGLLCARARPGSRPGADACILVFLWGAPSQYETFDPKPDAPDGIRGEFGTRPTRLPGVLFGEHVPLLAGVADRFSLLRTCAQSSTHHQSAAYEALTGCPPSRDAVALTATPADHPNLGSVVARFAPGRSALPRFVQLPQLASDVGNLTPGQFAGFLGRQYDPLAVIKDPSNPDFDVAELTLPADISAARLDDRAALLRQVDTLARSAEGQALGVFQERAVKLLTSPEVRRAFDLGQEPGALREPTFCKDGVRGWRGTSSRSGASNWWTNSQGGTPWNANSGLAYTTPSRMSLEKNERRLCRSQKLEKRAKVVPRTVIFLDALRRNYEQTAAGSVCG